MLLRRWVVMTVVFGLASLSAFGQVPENSTIATMKKDLFFLAGDECEGRGPGTAGIDKAADYIVKTFTDNGLKPGVKDGWFQPFTIGGTSSLGKLNEATFVGPDGKTIALDLGKNAQVMGLSARGAVEAPLVFVGYGVQSKSHKFDEYEGIDVAGKVVVLLRHLPRWNEKEPFGGKDRDSLASLEKKVATAEANKAAAVIVVNDATEIKSGDKVPGFDYLSGGTPSKIPCIHVKREVIEPAILAGLGKSLLDLEKGIDEDLKPRSGEVKGWSAKLETSVTRGSTNCKNVLGVVEGRGPLAKEIIVVGAHYDHLGAYSGKMSMARNLKDKQIHYGADDNGSGTTAMLELARRFAAKKDRESRKIVFMAFSAEERGLLGSIHYCKNPIFPLADTAAMVNLDMVGKMRPDPKTGKDKLIVQGLGTSKGFEAMCDKLNTPDFTFAKVNAGMGPSDHQSFYLKKVPVLFFWTGTHPDYHKPSDTPDKINYDGMKKIVDYVETVVEKLATDPVRPPYSEAKGSGGTSASSGPKGPKLGISPSYEMGKEPGLVVDAVSAGGVADKAGLKAGDRIVEIAGKNVTNIDTYMVVMAQQKLDTEIEVTVVRDGEKKTLKAMLK